jgi:hypothetical protein
MNAATNFTRISSTVASGTGSANSITCVFVLITNCLGLVENTSRISNKCVWLAI